MVDIATAGLASGIASLVAPIWGARDPAKRIVMVFACYLDEARTDAESALVTMAGYIAPYNDWLSFEVAAQAEFDARGVKILHAMDLHAGKREFRDWDRAKKENFVRVLQSHLKPTGAIGFAFSVAKAEFVAAKKLHKVMANESLYGFCFRSIVDLIGKDPVMRMNFDTIPGADVTFVLETGNKNKGDVERIFSALKASSPLRGRLKAVVFATKDSTKSLQMADLLAFYSRRHIAMYDDKGGEYPGVPEMLKILHTGIHIEPIKFLRVLRGDRRLGHGRIIA
jgi:hypothetical protein